MKFSIIGAATILLASMASVNAGDAYAEAIKKWCGGLSVPYPNGGTFTPGTELNVTVNNKPGDQQHKQIKTLQLYHIGKNGKLESLQNVWEGTQDLKTQAYLKTKLLENLPAGNYYYRLWITNLINGSKGPDCTPTSKVFRLSTGSHTNDAGELEYNEDLNDSEIYNPDHLRGCFGLTVLEPKENEVFTNGQHARITVERDPSAETDTIKRIELYKVAGDAESTTLIETIFERDESLFDLFNVKDHLTSDHDDDENTRYYYKIIGNNKNENDECAYFTPKFIVKSA